MPIHECRVIAIEGTHAAGKTTLVHALTAFYREQGIHAACTTEAARVSPFMEAITLHGAGDFDLVAELDLYAAALSAQLRASRNHTLLICDKTVMNVSAYARLVLDTQDPVVTRVLTALDGLSAAWASTCYDAVIYAADRFGQQDGGDHFRSKVLKLQDAADRAVRQECKAAGVELLELPTGLDTAARVQWVDERVRQRGLITG